MNDEVEESKTSSTSSDSKINETMQDDQQDQAAVEPNSNDTTNQVEEKENVPYIGKSVVCCACGNSNDLCHQVRFGFFLIQEAITMYKWNREPNNVTENMISNLFTER